MVRMYARFFVSKIGSHLLSPKGSNQYMARGREII